jgi:hypothetical protein
MTRFARIVDGAAVEIIEWSPEGRYPEDWVWVECPPETVQGSTFEDGEWDHPTPPSTVEPAPPAPARILQVSPPTFLLLFKSPERIAIRAARNYSGADAGANMVKAVLDDWFSIIDDPRLQYVDLALPATQQGIDFLVTAGLLTAPRAAEIKLGVAA